MNRAEKRAIVGIGSIFALRMFGLFMIVPVFSIYGLDYAYATPFLVGMAVGVYGLSQAIFQIPMSVLADRVSRKKVVLAGLSVFALGSVIAFLAQDIYTVIVGRALAGSGAVSAVLMALLADITTEQNRTKAMAFMGLIIATSIMLSFALGAIFVASLGMPNLFFLTAVLAVLAMPVLWRVVPDPVRMLRQNFTNQPLGDQLKSVLAVADLNRLHFGVLSLHLTLTAMFVILPHQFADLIGIGVRQQGYLYLILLFVGFILALPLIILAEKNRKMRQVFLLAWGLMGGALLALAGVMNLFASLGNLFWLKAIFVIALGVYFWGFNLLEATIPSWISKKSPVAYKATAMGINASSQFFGAFVGGSLGGVLLTLNAQTAWLILAGWAIVAFCLIFPIRQPPYLTSLAIAVPQDVDQKTWAAQILTLDGVDELVILDQEKLAYLKIDKKRLTEQAQEKLAKLTQSHWIFK